MRPLRSLLALGVVTIVSSAGVSAQGIDPHELYEQRCADCHVAHAGMFAHKSLVASEAGVFGLNSGRELRSFLAAGHGKLSAKEIDAVTEHLQSILRSGRLFHDKCRICHDRAVILARRELIIKDGELFGRYSGRNITEFLMGHGRLKGAEVSKMVDVLKRQLKTRTK